MRALGTVGLSLAMVLGLAHAAAEEVAWRPTGSAKPTAPAATVRLGRPVPLDAPAEVAPSTTASAVLPAAYSPPPRATLIPTTTLSAPQPIIRAQGAELSAPVPPPPPPPSPFAGPGEEAYNCGVVTGQRGGFFGRCWDHCREWFHGVPGSVQGIFQPGPGGRASLFQSDHTYDDRLISPVTNPFYFEDPRALTEIRPIFIWQETPRSNHIFAGGDNVFAGVQARLAVTDWFSVVIHQFGFTWMEPHNPFPEFGSHVGFSEFHIGPKFTFWRGDCLVMAAGLIFEIPWGPRKVFQDTGSLSLDPYFSLAWTFGDFDYGRFIFLNTTGYSASVDDERTEFLYSSAHLSFDVLKLNKVYPFVELNWLHYTVNGRTRDIGFEGRDLFHFGSNGAAGHDELTLALGLRYKISEAIQFGLAGETSLIGGGRHLDRFRITADMIFRY